VEVIGSNPIAPTNLIFRRFNQLGDLGKARDHFEQALGEAESAPKAGLSPYYTARIQYELALIAYKDHRFDDAARQLAFASADEIQDQDLSRGIDALKVLLKQASAP
jgi:hypothetical protein